MVKSAKGLINSYEGSDIIHIMKMNRFALIDSDTAKLTFSKDFKEKDYTVAILMVENERQVVIKQNKSAIMSQTLKIIYSLENFP